MRSVRLFQLGSRPLRSAPRGRAPARALRAPPATARARAGAAGKRLRPAGCASSGGGTPGSTLSVVFHGRGRATPVGPAAGPQRQLAQNIVLAWLGGLPDHRAEDDPGARTSWRSRAPASTPPTWATTSSGRRSCGSRESLREYVKGSMLMRHPARARPGLGVAAAAARHDLRHERRLRPGRHPHQAACATGFAAMKDASALVDRAARARSPTTRAATATSTSPRGSLDRITLSTFHGCPPDEIERIIDHLLTELDVDVIVKLNPTLLGPRGGRAPAPRRAGLHGDETHARRDFEKEPAGRRPWTS